MDRGRRTLMASLLAVLMVASPQAVPTPTSSSSAGGPATAPLSIRIVEPAGGAFVSGPTAIVAVVESASGMAVERVEFEVNGRVVAAPAVPPWRVVHDFGQGYEAWLIRVRAHGAGGIVVEDTVTTRRLTVHEEAGVELVNVFATVRDGRGRFVLDLPQEDFLVLEDGRRQQLAFFSKDRLPLAVEIVLDTSNSMKGTALREAQRAAAGFIDALAPGDKAGVMEFNDTVRELHQLDDSLKETRDAIRTTRARGGTALYDAVAAAARRLVRLGEDRRLAIILLSDGRDEAYSGLTPGSLLTFEETLAEAIDTGVIIYAIGLGAKLDEKLDFFGRHSLEEVLTTLALETGGQAYFTLKANKLDRTYRQIGDELRHHYSLAYSPSNRRRDGSWRSIEVRIARAGHTVRARRGYYAPGKGVLP